MLSEVQVSETGLSQLKERRAYILLAGFIDAGHHEINSLDPVKSVHVCNDSLALETDLP